MKKVKAWLFICNATSPKTIDIYNTRSDAERGMGNCDIVVPCVVTFTLPKTLKAKSKKV